jgi:hypothetical protein
MSIIILIAIIALIIEVLILFAVACSSINHLEDRYIQIIKMLSEWQKRI